MTKWDRTEELEAIAKYLGPAMILGGTHVIRTGLHALLEDARNLTHRDNHGHTEQDTPSWSGAVSYLILLDQIGTAVRPYKVQPVSGNSFQRSLIYWAPQLSEEDRDTLYGLRCALAHDYSLFHAPRGSGPSYLFELDPRPGQLIRPAVEAWNKDYSRTGPDHHTAVSLRELGDLVESVIANMRAGQLEVAVDGGARELSVRYGIAHPRFP